MHTSAWFSTLVFLISFIAGVLGALTGLGGGVVITPALVLLFGVDLRHAIGASLVSVIATSSGAASAYVREGFSNIRLDSQRRWDFSLNKSFRINERARVRFRADTFNALNEPVLRGPNTTVTSSAFGTITAQEPPRSFQFSLQMVF